MMCICRCAYTRAPIHIPMDMIIRIVIIMRKAAGVSHNSEPPVKRRQRRILSRLARASACTRAPRKSKTTTHTSITTRNYRT